MLIDDTVGIRLYDLSNVRMRRQILRMIPLEPTQEESNGIETISSEARDKLLAIYAKIFQRVSKWNRRLEEEPNGFAIEGNTNCLVCQTLITQSTGWYSEYGMTCIMCLKAFKKGAIPKFISKHPKSFYCLRELSNDFGMSRQVVMKQIQKAALVPRIIYKNDGEVYSYIFLKKENLFLVILNDTSIEKAIRRHNERMAKKWKFGKIKIKKSNGRVNSES